MPRDLLAELETPTDAPPKDLLSNQETDTEQQPLDLMGGQNISERPPRDLLAESDNQSVQQNDGIVSNVPEEMKTAYLADKDVVVGYPSSMNDADIANQIQERFYSIPIKVPQYIKDQASVSRRESTAPGQPDIEINPKDFTFGEQLLYPFQRILSQTIEKPAWAITEAILRGMNGVYKYGLSLMDDFNLARGIQTNEPGFLDKAVDYYSRPELYGFVTPPSERKRAELRQMNYQRNYLLGIAGDISDSITDLMAFMMPLELSAQLSAKSAQLATNTSILKDFVKGSAKLSTYAFFTHSGELTERAKSAIFMLGYNLTPYIANATGAVSLNAMGVNAVLNTFLSSPSYASILKQSGGINKEFAALSIPQFVMDFGFAWHTRGLPENIAKTKLDNYLKRRVKEMELPKEEAERLIMATKAILTNPEFFKKNEEINENLRRAYLGLRKPSELTIDELSAELNRFERKGKDKETPEGKTIPNSAEFLTLDELVRRDAIREEIKSRQEKAANEYESYLNELEKQGVLKLDATQRRKLIDEFKKFPLGRSVKSKQGETIRFIPRKGQSVSEYVHHFLTKRGGGREFFSTSHLSLLSEIGKTITKYDERFLGQYQGEDRIYYVRKFDGGKEPNHIVVIGTDKNGNVVDIALTHFKTKDNYVANRLLAKEKYLVEERGLVNQGGEKVDLNYDEYSRDKGMNLFYLGNKFEDQYQREPSSLTEPTKNIPLVNESVKAPETEGESTPKKTQQMTDEEADLASLAQKIGQEREYRGDEINVEDAMTDEQKLKKLYDSNFKMTQSKEAVIPAVKKSASGLKEKAAVLFEPISTRVKKMNEKLRARLRRFEFDVKNRTMEAERDIRPFLQAYSKLSSRDHVDLDLALKNGHTKMIDSIITNNKMAEEFKAVRKVLDSIYQRAKEVDLDIGYLENYFPRKVGDYSGFMDYFKQQNIWPELQEVLEQRQSVLGRELNFQEQAEIINTLLRGYSPGSKISLGRPKNFLEREVEYIDADLNRHYEDSSTALINYVVKANEFIEARRFFGKSAKGNDMTKESLDASIGAFVLNLLEKDEISAHNAMDLESILKSRFNQQGPNGFWAGVRDFSYIETMGNFGSAITQIGDIAFNFYKNGFYRASKSMLKAMAGDAKLKRDDIGIERISEEFVNRKGWSKLLDQTFKLVGLDAMDRFGKETLINASLEKYQALSKNPTPEFKELMKTIFGDKAGDVIKDLRNGVTSADVKFLLFNELSDVQPISLSEMPEQYLKYGNGRIFYMLKTYMIKQLDVFQNESLMLIRSGEKQKVIQGIQNFVYLSVLLTAANGSADVIKNLIFGRPIDLPDLLVDNLVRLSGLSKYTIYKAKDMGPAEAFADFITPPTRLFKSAVIDATDIWKGDFDPNEAEVIQSIPILGKFYYWWFGKGRAKIEKKARGSFKR